MKFLQSPAAALSFINPLHPLNSFIGPSPNRRGGIALIAALTVLASDPASAVNGAWNVNADGNWATAGNWAASIADGQNDLADFSAINITADRTVTITTNRTIGDLRFGDATTPNFNWILSSSNGSTVNLRNTGGGIADIDVVNQTATISLVLTSQNTSAVQKLGNGTLILTAANTYALPTQINAGTLLANNTTGSATSSGSVSVASGAKLGGTGTISPTGSNGISVSGVLAPGGAVGSVGTLALNLAGTTGTVVMNSGASLNYELGLGGLSIDSVGTADLLAIAGAASGDFTFTNNVIDFLGTGTNGFYKLFDTSSGNANTWNNSLTFNGTTGIITAGLSVSNLAAGKTGTLLIGTASNGGALGDIFLQVVPEPSSAMLAVFGSGLLLRRRRTRV